MSDITKLTTKIIQDAEEKYTQHLAEATTEIKQREYLAIKQLEKESEERLVRFKKDLDQQMHRKVSDVDIRSRNVLLGSKQKVLQNLFKEAVETLNEMTEAQFTEFVVSGLKATDFIGEVTLKLGEKSKKYHTEQASKQWQEASENINLSIDAQTIPNSGGYLLQQGDIEMNMLFESLIQAAEEELSVSLLERIFDR